MDDLIIEVVQRGACGIKGAWIQRRTANIVIITLNFSVKWIESSGSGDGEFSFDVYHEPKAIDRRDPSEITTVRIIAPWLGECPQSICQTGKYRANICL